MATKSKYPGVTPWKSGWQYRIKIRIDGKNTDTTIKYDSDGNPFLRARDAYAARLAHIDQLRNKPVEIVLEPSVTLLSDVYDNYMQTEAKTKAAATLRKQDSMWRNWVCDRFGDKDINLINLIDLESFLFEIYKDHSYKYTEAFLKFFYLLFTHAYKMEQLDPERYLRMFVTRGSRLSMPEMHQLDKEEEDKGVLVYTDHEIELMEKAFDTEDGNCKLAFHLGLYCGLRISECFALRWRDIDFDNNVININRQLQYLDGSFRLCSVKTLKSVRKIYITEDFAQELWFYYNLQCSQKEKLQNGYRDTERIYDEVENKWLEDSERDFVNRKKNGELLTINSMKYWTRKINPILKEDARQKHEIRLMANCGIDVKFEFKEFKYHALRHTFATRCASHNVSFFMLQQMMGHLKIDTTQKYYINIDNDYVVEHTKELLGELYKLD